MATLQALALQLQSDAASFPEVGIARDLVSAAQAGIRNVAGRDGISGSLFRHRYCGRKGHMVALVISLCVMYEYQLRQPGPAGTIT